MATSQKGKAPERKSKRQFDLSKESDNVTPIENIAEQEEQIANEFDPIPEKPQSFWKSRWAIMLIVACVVIAGLIIWWCMPANRLTVDDEEALEGPQTEEIAETPEGEETPSLGDAPEAAPNAEAEETNPADASGNVVESPKIKESDGASSTASATTNSETASNSTPQSADEPKAAGNTPSYSEPKAKANEGSSAPASTRKFKPKTSLDRKAMSVIAGQYGKNPERRKNLGKEYRKVQRRVNELKRQGAF